MVVFTVNKICYQKTCNFRSSLYCKQGRLTESTTSCQYMENPALAWLNCGVCVCLDRPLTETFKRVHSRISGRWSVHVYVYFSLAVWRADFSVGEKKTGNKDDSSWMHLQHTRKLVADKHMYAMGLTVAQQGNCESLASYPGS